MVFFTMEEDVVGFERDADCFSSQLYMCRINIGFIYLRFIGNYYFTINTSFFKICSGSIDIHVSHPSNAIVNLPPSSKNYESEINTGYHAHEMWVRLYNYYITFGNISDNTYFLDRTSNLAGKLGYWRSSENLMLPSVII